MTEKPKEYPGVREFVKVREKELEAVLKVYTDEDTWTFALSRLREHFHGDFSPWHDNYSRFRQHVIRDFLSGSREVGLDELRQAVLDLSASHRAACESNYNLKRDLEQVRRYRPRPSGLIPPRRALA